MTAEPLVEIKGLKNFLGGKWVHDGVDLQIEPGEIAAIIGGSGSGKTTILRSLLMLQMPTAGRIKLFGQDVSSLSEDGERNLRRRIGMLFQQGALFSGLTVIENIMYPIQQHTELPTGFIKELAYLKLSLVGLNVRDGYKYPSELSGGMKKRVAAARALALDPELLLLDEPLSGLDPRSGLEFDKLLLFLRERLNLTIVKVSHDMASLKRVTDKIIFLGKGRVLAVGTFDELCESDEPVVANYFKSTNIVAGISP